jgi:hypothetical protein
MWSKWFGHSHPDPLHTPVPVHHDIKDDFDPVYLEKVRPRTKETTLRALRFDRGFGFLRKAKQRAIHRSQLPRNRQVVKFQPLDVDELYSSDSDSGLDDVKSKALLESPVTIHVQPWLTSRPSMGSILTDSTELTLLDMEPLGARIKPTNELDRNEKKKAKSLMPRQHMHDVDHPFTEDRTSETKTSHHDPRWAPPFLRQLHKSPKEDKGSRGGETPPGDVPMTHSLINAPDPIGVAQEQAYGSSASYASSDSASQTVHEGPPAADHEDQKYGGMKWDMFWKDVNYKVKQGR